MSVAGLEQPPFVRFVALGDSTTEGLEDPYSDGRGYRGWADRLAERLALLNPEMTYANLAIRGRKVPQVRAEQLEPALNLEPDLASVLGGINDILRRNLDLDALIADLDAMTIALDAQGATVLTFTFPDPTATITFAADKIRARVEAFNGRLRSMATARGAVLVDLERDGIAHPTLWCDDRLHANAAGHERIAGAAAEALGFPDPDSTWLQPLPDPAPTPAISRYAADAVWMTQHLTPWLIRRLRGRSSGDGREPKRPDLTPVAIH
jgi:lysophospholipase L1-like esterase